MEKTIKPLVIALLTAVVSVGGVVNHSWEGITAAQDKEIPGNNVNTDNAQYKVIGFGTIAKSTDGGKTWEAR